MYLSIICQKGGVGKTTMSVNISDVYSKRNEKTLLIDLDPQGNATTYLLGEKIGEFDSLDLLQNKKKIKIEELKKVKENLYLIPSNPDIKRLVSRKIIGGSVLQNRRKDKQFAQFDKVIIDTPPSMNSLVNEAICFSDYYLIPTRAEYLSVEGVGQAVDYVRDVISTTKNISPIFLGVVLNSVDKRRSSFRNFKSELENILGDKLFNNSISQLTDIAEAPFHGKTLSEYNPKGTAFKEVTLLIEEIDRKIEEYL